MTVYFYELNVGELDITHADAYDLIDKADSVKEAKGDKGGFPLTLRHGLMSVKLSPLSSPPPMPAPPDESEG